MAITLIFLISCIITARMLEKKKMRVASVVYSVVFALLLIALLLTIDFEPLRHAFVRLMGARPYLEINLAFNEAIASAGYGTCIGIALALTFILQISLGVFCAVRTIVRFFKKWREAYLSKREKFRTISPIRNIYTGIPINLLYCRMLN